MKNITVVFICLIIYSCSKGFKNTKLSGTVFGTSYSVIYSSEINYQKKIDSLFYAINKSMSTYQLNSDISKLNRNESNLVDKHFIKVFEASKKIYKETNGAFDPTIGVLVNAWGFGPKNKIVNLDNLKIKHLMQSVGFDRVKLIDKIIEKPKAAFIDFNAIAKGYAVDVISNFLSSNDVKNYLVNIGGELRASGINIEKQWAWRVGVENPDFDGTQSINHTISIKNKAMATSGTYRKFKIDKNGNRYAHIIDTKTGYPSKTNLLSISVIADNCTTADAYATAFKTMGIERVKAFLKTHPKLKVFLIYENDKKELKTLNINAFLES